MARSRRWPDKPETGEEDQWESNLSEGDTGVTGERKHEEEVVVPYVLQVPKPAYPVGSLAHPDRAAQHPHGIFLLSLPHPVTVSSGLDAASGM